MVRAQAVDATPSGIRLLSKGVFMTQGKRFGLSAVQKSDMWCRWQARLIYRDRLTGNPVPKPVELRSSRDKSSRYGSACHRRARAVQDEPPAFLNWPGASSLQQDGGRLYENKPIDSDDIGTVAV